MVKELIMTHDEVWLPGVGSFVAEVVPATFSDKGFTINPPYRRLYFRHRHESGESSLVEFYASSNGIELGKAEMIVNGFLSELRTVLEERKMIVFPGLGRLRATKENNFFFVADEDLDIFPKGFGLDRISLKSHEETRSEVSAAVAGLKSIMDNDAEAATGVHEAKDYQDAGVEAASLDAGKETVPGTSAVEVSDAVADTIVPGVAGAVVAADEVDVESREADETKAEETKAEETPAEVMVEDKVPAEKTPAGVAVGEEAKTGEAIAGTAVEENARSGIETTAVSVEEHAGEQVAEPAEAYAEELPAENAARLEESVKEEAVHEAAEPEVLVNVKVHEEALSVTSGTEADPSDGKPASIQSAGESITVLSETTTAAVSSEKETAAVPSAEEQETAPAKKSTWKRLLNVLVYILLVLVVLFVLYFITARIAPDFIDRLLYNEEELEIINFGR